MGKMIEEGWEGLSGNQQQKGTHREREGRQERAGQGGRARRSPETKLPSESQRVENPTLPCP